MLSGHPVNAGPDLSPEDEEMARRNRRNATSVQKVAPGVYLLRAGNGQEAAKQMRRLSGGTVVVVVPVEKTSPELFHALATHRRQGQKAYLGLLGSDKSEMPETVICAELADGSIDWRAIIDALDGNVALPGKKASEAPAELVHEPEEPPAPPAPAPEPKAKKPRTKKDVTP